MLVPLLKLQPLAPLLLELEGSGVVIRRAQPFEITRVRSFAEATFSVCWGDEVSIGFAHKPISVYIAVAEQEIVGVAGYECTRRGFFGPMGVSEKMRRRGVGKALLLACLWGLREMGYVYGIIGHAGSVEFYEKTVGAHVIPASEPGIYRDFLK